MPYIDNADSMMLRAARLVIVVFANVTLVIALTSCGATRRAKPSADHGSPNFAVFSDRPTPDDMPARDVVTMLSQSSQPEFSDRNIRAARRILARYPSWLVPAENGELCLVRRFYPLVATVHGIALPPVSAFTCTSTTQAESGHLTETQSLATSGTGSRYTRVLGVVPDGVTKVAIIVRRGSERTVNVIRNAYEAIVTDPVAVRFVAKTNGALTTRTIRLTTFSGHDAPPERGTLSIGG